MPLGPDNACRGASRKAPLHREIENDMGHTDLHNTAAARVTTPSRPPRVVAVEPLPAHVLLVRFDNAVVKTYDMEPLPSLDVFERLNDPQVFRTVRVENGGYAVVWGDFADVSEHELWHGGVAQS